MPMADASTHSSSLRSALLAGPLRTLLPLAVVIVFFGLMDTALHGGQATFWTLHNLQTISVQNAFVAIAALGMLLIMIAGGIDLSAGMALALCATIVAWGMREDIGFLIAKGQNIAGAAHRLKQASDALRTAKNQNLSNELATLQAEFDRTRTRLVELLKIKLDQLQIETLPKSTGALKVIAPSAQELHDVFSSIESNQWLPEDDPYWLRLVPNSSASAWLAILLGVGAGVLCGLLNGMLIVLLRVVPFIATLGTMTIYLGLAKIVADETAVRPLPSQIPEWLGALSAVRPDPAWLLVSKGVWLALGLSALVACVLRYTVFGRYVFALGSNEATARLCGINVPLVKITVYGLAGLLLGIASVCFFSRLNSGSPTAGTGMELKFIAAVVIGGGSLSGGRGTVLGTLAGTAIMGIISSGCTQLGMRDPLQDIIVGVIIIAAVAIDQLRRR
jgi:ribose/xylose/arabinose/galactoside ABC-type transport system permease subunit